MNSFMPNSSNQRSNYIDKQQAAQLVATSFESQNIAVMMIKGYSQDSDIDLVVIQNNQYDGATTILNELGYAQHNNLSKIRETDKDFYCHKTHEYKVHLHRKISWNTVTFLDKKLVWQRRVKKEGVWHPSNEDELLIIAAHSVFENKRITEEEYTYAKVLVGYELDKQYIESHTKKFHWRSAYLLIIKKLDADDRFMSFGELNAACWKKLLFDLVTFRWFELPRQFMNYTIIDNIWCYRNALIDKKRSVSPTHGIIVFSGVDGSGKTTLAEHAEKILLNKNISVGRVHMGGGKFLHPPSLIHDNNLKKKPIGSVGIMIGVKDVITILAAVAVVRLTKKYVIYDRYIYDTIAKLRYRYTYSPIFDAALSFLVARPVYWFQLQADPRVTHERDNDHSFVYHINKAAIYNDVFKDFSAIHHISIDAALPLPKIVELVEKTLRGL